MYHRPRLGSASRGANAAANARLVLACGKDYLFRVKAEQPTIFNECVRRLGRKSVSSGLCAGSYIHGSRVVTRYLWFDDGLAGWHGYPGLRCAIRMRAHAVDKTTGEVTTEDRYYVTSMDSSVLAVHHWAELLRRHWSVENNCHAVWDKQFREDKRPWVRVPRAMLNVMALRRIAYTTARPRAAERGASTEGASPPGRDSEGARNLMAWFRNVTQRGERQRQVPWKRLMTLFRDMVVGLTDEVLRRPRPLEVLAFD